jgi:hypothetical protein
MEMGVRITPIFFPIQLALLMPFSYSIDEPKTEN